ncbi:MAG: hypothetical protein KGN16_25735, partial [Burkholderiales bacterium]|nr:hypothetical protein [Burkholderiales bacterium]
MKHQPFHSLRQALTLVFTLALARAGVAAPPPPLAFFADPQMSQAQLAPDGMHVAFLLGSPKTHRQLGVLDLRTMKPEVVASFKEQDVTEFHWVNDRRLAFRLDYHSVGPGLADSGPGLHGVDVDGARYRSLGRWDTQWVARADGENVFVTRAQEQSRQKVDYFIFHRLNTVTGRADEVELPLHTVDAVADNHGEFRAVLTASEGRQAMLLRQADGSWKSVAEFDALGKSAIRPLWIGPDDTLYVQAAAGDKSAVYAFDPATG